MSGGKSSGSYRGATYHGWALTWIAALGLLALDPRIVMVHLVGSHQFAQNSLSELIPRGCFVLTICLLLWTLWSVKVRPYIPAANAAVVLMVTWLVIGPVITRDTTGSPFGAALLGAFGLFVAYRAWRWTWNLLRACRTSASS